MRSSAVIGLSLWLGDIRVYRVRLIDAVSRIYDIDPQSPVPLSRSPLLDHRAGLFPGVCGRIPKVGPLQLRISGLVGASADCRG